MKKDKVSILECTLRDGSYLIDYQFTAEDTYIVSLALERAGFKLIEIGHGTGLRSSLVGKDKAAASDEEYLLAAQTALSGSDALFGMFFIPGIGKMEDLDMTIQYGMGFVRIGTNVTEIDQAKPYIEHAKELGMHVFSNLMKSYAVSIDDFVKLAKKADEYGADVITVVDSAGGMFPQDVREYVTRLSDVTDKTIGFHGHNNLQFAIANSLEAVKAGAGIVDSSIQGMGRSAGNAQTEILIMALEKLGYYTGVDSYRAMDLGERIIKPMMNREQGVDDMSVIAGIAQFHSSFSSIIEEAAKRHRIDPRILIMEVSEIDRVRVTPELAEETAKRIKKRPRKKGHFADSGIDIGFIERKKEATGPEKLALLVNEIVSLSKKTGLEPVFSLTLSKTNETVFPFIRKSPSMIIGNCEARNVEEIRAFIGQLDGRVEWILLDENNESLATSGIETMIKKSSHAWYSEDRALRLSIMALLSQKRPKGAVLIIADPTSVALMTLSLKRAGIKVLSLADIDLGGDNKALKKEFSGIDVIVSFDKTCAETLIDHHANLLKDETEIYTARPHAFNESFWKAAVSRGFDLFRIDSRIGFAAELFMVIETKRLINTMGAVTIANVPVVSGGVIGSRGAVIVDSVTDPTKVIGIADGMGGIMSTEGELPYSQSLERVRGFIINEMYEKKY